MPTRADEHGGQKERAPRGHAETHRKTNREREKARRGKAVAPQGNGSDGIFHHGIVVHDGATFASAARAFRGERWRTGPLLTRALAEHDHTNRLKQDQEIEKQACGS